MPFNLIVIGGSTGGPRILRKLLNQLPNLNAAVLIVQHMPKYINESLRRSLDSLSSMPVKIAQDNEFLKHGMIYLAPSERHLRLIRNKQVILNDSEKVNLCKPSIDVTMQSLKHDDTTNLIGVLLPGMGIDGADGIQHIKNIHGTTYAIEDSRKALYESINYAKERNAIDNIVNISNMKKFLIEDYASISKSENMQFSPFTHKKNHHQSEFFPRSIQKTNNKLIIIGSSTGGPRILKRILMDLPRLNVPIVLVQHMPEFINVSFQMSLNNLTEMDVTLANDGENLMPGKFYIAPSNIHLTLENNNTKIKLVQGEKVNFCRPAIDVAMKSLRKVHNQNIMGIILTGMGHDGADGLSYIKRELQGITVSEDEDSCIVYGMPKAAFDTGDIDYVLNPEEIQSAIIKFGT